MRKNRIRIDLETLEDRFLLSTMGDLPPIAINPAPCPNPAVVGESAPAGEPGIGDESPNADSSSDNAQEPQYVWDAASEQFVPELRYIWDASSERFVPIAKTNEPAPQQRRDSVQRVSEPLTLCPQAEVAANESCSDPIPDAGNESPSLSNDPAFNNSSGLRHLAGSTSSADNVLTAPPPGMHTHHDRVLTKIAEDEGLVIIVRDANPESLPYQGRKGHVPKPVTCKAKSAHCGAQAGLVVDPTHPHQASQSWTEGRRLLEQGDPEAIASFQARQQRSLEAWNQFEGQQLRKPGSGYTVNPNDGTVQLHGDKIYGDYDLHGVHDAETGERINFGEGGKAEDSALADARKKGDTPDFVQHRNAVNDQVTPGARQGRGQIQHGANADYDVPNKKPDLPATAYTPDGKRVRLEDADELRRFHDSRRLDWDFGDSTKPSAKAGKFAKVAKVLPFVDIALGVYFYKDNQAFAERQFSMQGNSGQLADNFRTVGNEDAADFIELYPNVFSENSGLLGHSYAVAQCILFYGVNDASDIGMAAFVAGTTDWSQVTPWEFSEALRTDFVPNQIAYQILDCNAIKDTIEVATDWVPQLWAGKKFTDFVMGVKKPPKVDTSQVRLADDYWSSDQGDHDLRMMDYFQKQGKGREARRYWQASGDNNPDWEWFANHFGIPMPG